MAKLAQTGTNGKKIGRRDFLRLAGVTTAGVILSACAPGTIAPTEVPSGGGATDATVQPTTAATMAATGEIGREDTLIIGFEGEPVQAPNMANPYTPGSRINQGYHQAMIESLWYLNYQTGDSIPGWPPCPCQICNGMRIILRSTSHSVRVLSGATANLSRLKTWRGH